MCAHANEYVNHCQAALKGPTLYGFLSINSIVMLVHIPLAILDIHSKHIGHLWLAVFAVIWLLLSCLNHAVFCSSAGPFPGCLWSKAILRLSFIFMWCQLLLVSPDHYVYWECLVILSLSVHTYVYLYLSLLKEELWPIPLLILLKVDIVIRIYKFRFFRQILHQKSCQVTEIASSSIYVC